MKDSKTEDLIWTVASTSRIWRS